MSDVITEGQPRPRMEKAPPPQKEYNVSESEGRRDTTPREDVYKGDTGKLTPDSLLNKLNKLREKKGEGKLTPKMHETDIEEPAHVEEAAVEEPEAPQAQEEETPELLVPQEVKPDEKVEEEPEVAAASAEPEEEKVEEAPAAKTKKGESEKPAYKLDPKFSALSKQYELPKFLQAAIKTPEQEKEIKDIYSKAMGLDHVKMRNQELQDNFENVSQQHNDVVGGIQDLREIFSEATKPGGNILLLDDWLASLKIRPETILQYAAEKIQFMELPQDRQQTLLMQLNNQRALREQQKQNVALQTRSHSQTVQARTRELDYVLAKPEIATVAQKFDSQPGRQAGAFAELVRETGRYAWHKSNGTVDLSAEDAVKHVIDGYGLKAFASAGNPPQAALAGKEGAAPSPDKKPVVKAPQPHNKVPVIPGVQGSSGASPTRAKPRSIEDLKKLHQKAVAKGKG